MNNEQESKMRAEIDQALIESTSAAEFHAAVAAIRIKYGVPAC